jgi:8-oxo-dGTP pyrophosphatase MutT (NUDIX family)
MGYVAELRALVGPRPLLIASAGVLVVDGGGRILLQHRADDGLWGIPGGALEPGETFEDAARRELREETGLVAHSLRLVDTYSGPQFFLRYPNGDEAFVVGTTFVCEDSGGDPRADGVEGIELGWFATHDLPVLNAFNRVLVTRCLAGLP